LLFLKVIFAIIYLIIFSPFCKDHTAETSAFGSRIVIEARKNKKQPPATAKALKPSAENNFISISSPFIFIYLKRSFFY